MLKHQVCITAKTVLRCESLVKGSAAFLPLTLMVQVPLMCSVIINHPVGGGGGGWTVFQKGLDGSVEFYRGWNDYKRGFGNLYGEFWLRLEKSHRLTKSERYILRVDLEDTAGKTAYAEYDMFAVTSEITKYQLGIGTYSGICLRITST